MSSISFEDIGLSGAMLRAVEKKARTEGKTPPEYLRALIERDLLIEKPFDEILKPVRAGFKRSGITPEELDRVVAKARAEIYSRKKRKATK